MSSLDEGTNSLFQFGMNNNFSKIKKSHRENFEYTFREISDATALDFDSSTSRVYWSDIEEKTISRAFTNGTGRPTLL